MKKHLKALDRLKTEFEKDTNIIAFLVFGSVAKDTFHENSDIDLFIVYKKFEDGYEYSTGVFENIKLGYSKYSEEKLRYNATHFPYRMYVFAHAKILFDKNSIDKIQSTLITYFEAHPEVQKEWDHYNKIYEDEKIKFGSGKTNIRDVYNELDRKFKRPEAS